MTSCRKIPYPTRRAAQIACARVGGGQRPYQCPRCGWWHLSIRSRRDVKAARKQGEVRPHPDAG